MIQHDLVVALFLSMSDSTVRGRTQGAPSDSVATTRKMVRPPVLQCNGIPLARPLLIDIALIYQFIDQIYRC